MELNAPHVGSAIRWGVAGRPLAGEERSGDLHVVTELDDGMLVAIIDGLGHGDGAADAAASAGEILERHAAEPLELLVPRCHEGMRHTRGAVMGLARFHDAGSMTWLAVGDAEGVLVPEDADQSPIRSMPQHRGIVGRNLPMLRSVSFDLTPGDLVIMATDGVGADGLRRSLLRSTPQWLATDILARSARPNDDALVLVVRYGGTA
jgi:phosphoserine phosphatase RsbX